MTAEVVSLDKFKPKKQDLVYGCTNCGTQLFYISYDEALEKVVLECRGCKSVVVDLVVSDGDIFDEGQ